MAQKKLECLPLAGFLTIFGHIYIWCDSNFDGRHSNFFWAIIHLFLHPSLKQISPRIPQGSTTTHTEKSIKNPWVIYCYALFTWRIVSLYLLLHVFIPLYKRCSGRALFLNEITLSLLSSFFIFVRSLFHYLLASGLGLLLVMQLLTVDWRACMRWSHATVSCSAVSIGARRKVRLVLSSIWKMSQSVIRKLRSLLSPLIPHGIHLEYASFHVESMWNPPLHMEYVLAKIPLILGSPFHLDSIWNGDGMVKFHME